MRLICRKFAIVLVFGASLMSLFLSSAVAQDSKTGDAYATWNNRFVPNDAYAVILASPSELVQNEFFAAFLIEIFKSRIVDTYGIDLSDIALARIILGPPEANQIVVGIVLEMTRPFDEGQLLKALNLHDAPTSVGDFIAYPIALGPPGTIIHMA